MIAGDAGISGRTSGGSECSFDLSLLLLPQSSVVQQLRSTNIKGVKALEAKRAHLVKEAAKEAQAREAARLAELEAAQAEAGA